MGQQLGLCSAGQLFHLILVHLCIFGLLRDHYCWLQADSHRSEDSWRAIRPSFTWPCIFSSSSRRSELVRVEVSGREENQILKNQREENVRRFLYPRLAHPHFSFSPWCWEVNTGSYTWEVNTPRWAMPPALSSLLLCSTGQSSAQAGKNIKSRKIKISLW